MKKGVELLSSGRVPRNTRKTSFGTGKGTEERALRVTRGRRAMVCDLFSSSKNGGLGSNCC